MNADFIPAYNVADLTEVRIYDSSTYDTTTISDIGAVRMLFGNVPAINGVDTNVTTLYAWNQYIVTSGSVSLYGKTYTTGDYIYLANTVTISNESVTVSQTGYYGGITTWTPSSGTYASFTPSQSIYNSNNIYYPDYVFLLQYELYGQRIAHSVALTDAIQYIVTGDAGNYITYGGATYYVGEVFTTSGTDPFTNGVGTNYVNPLVASTTQPFYTWYNNWNLLSAYMDKIAKSYSTTADFQADFVAVYARNNANSMFAEQNFGLSLTGIQNNLDSTLANYAL